MAHGRGFLYEEKVQKILEPKAGTKLGNIKNTSGGVPKSGKKSTTNQRTVPGTSSNPCLTKTGVKPAGAGAEIPDLQLWFPHLPGTPGLGKGFYGVELKLAAASGGSLVIHYNHKKDKWIYGEVGEDEEEKQELVNLADELGVMRKLNSSAGWGGSNQPAPWNTTQKSPSASPADKEEWIQYMIESGTSQKDRYDIDYSHFPEIKFPFAATAMERYYNIKKCYYMQVGDRGLFLLGSRDPLNLNKNLNPKIPRWHGSATTVLRVRCQYKASSSSPMNTTPNKKMRDTDPQKRSTSSKYQFALDVSFNVKKSPYSIGPLKPGKNPGGDPQPLTSPDWNIPQTLLDLAAGGEIQK
jgi:hypothetical protein